MLKNESFCDFYDLISKCQMKIAWLHFRITKTMNVVLKGKKVA